MNSCYLNPYTKDILRRFPAFENTLWSGIWLVRSDRDYLVDPITIDEIFEFLIYKLFV